MKLKLFTLRAAEKLLEEDQTLINAFFEEHQVIQIETAYIGVGDTLWSVAVIYEIPFQKKGLKEQATKLLSEADGVRFEELKKWRTAHARSQNVPPYRVATNRELQAVLIQKPTDLESLRSIPGFGEAKVNSYGEDLLKELKIIFPV
ncbi:HRDC domain-containing protein [Chryseobacterium sp. A321]